MASSLFENSERGFQEAQAYETYRPGYSTRVVNVCFDQASISQRLRNNEAQRYPNQHAGLRIVDLAAGTGKLTELLAARQADVAHIVAIEPHHQMRQVLAAKQLPNVDVRDGRAENMGEIEDGWADVITVAQAFHWFATTQALTEIGRCLKPNGILFLAWNEEDYNSPASVSPVTSWEQGLREIAWQQDRQQSGFRSGRKWEQIFSPDSIDYTVLRQTWSLPLNQETIEWTVFLNRELLWQRFKSLSFITNLEANALLDIESKFDRLLAGEGTQRNAMNEIEVHGRTRVYWLHRI